MERPVGTLPLHLWGPDDGIPVLLLHGFPQTSRSWHAVVDRLLAARDDLLLAAPDQRGYAPDARPDDVAAYAIGELTDDVLAMADALGAGTFHLVGHDWGASLGWHLAAHHAERVRSLTALSIPHLAAYGWAIRHDPEQQRLGSYLRVFRTPGHGETALLQHDARRLREIYDGRVSAEDVEAYVELMRDGALTPALGWYRAMGGELARTPAVDVATTYVWGSQDQAVSRAASDRCGEFVRGAFRHVELGGASHWTPDERPDDVARAVLETIARGCPG
ncbi:alpha/beta hydrolase [Nocardioidaceae bacterium]|nr:alpha/beta hydrolase [Nocardioidaceae bacterium]